MTQVNSGPVGNRACYKLRSEIVYLGLCAMLYADFGGLSRQFSFAKFFRRVNGLCALDLLHKSLPLQIVAALLHNPEAELDSA